jgi:hypothetical protein
MCVKVQVANVNNNLQRMHKQAADTITTGKTSHHNCIFKTFKLYETTLTYYIFYIKPHILLTFDLFTV